MDEVVELLGMLKQIIKIACKQMILPKMKYVDSIPVFKDIVKLDSYSQKSLCKYYGIIQKNAHRAIGDVIDLSAICLRGGISIVHLDKFEKEIGDVKDIHSILLAIELFKNTDEKVYIISDLNSKDRRLIHIYIDMFNIKNGVKYIHETNRENNQLHITRN